MSVIRIPLESIYKFKSNTVPLNVVDFRVALHCILGTVTQFGQAVGLTLKTNATEQEYECFTEQVVANDLWLGYIRATWAMRLMRGPDMLPRSDYRLIVVDDSKKQIDDDKFVYWRHFFAPEYKGTRTKSAISAYDSIRDVGMALCKELCLPFYSEELYEADDWAGLIYRIKRQAEPNSTLADRELFYSTVDSDWLQLVDDASKQLWANTGPWPSRLKNEAETRAYVLKRMGKAISHPREIAKVKQETGDSADNLAVGSKLFLFDLCNPCPEYDLSKTVHYQRLVNDLNNSEANTKAKVLTQAATWLNANGLPITVRP